MVSIISQTFISSEKKKNEILCFFLNFVGFEMAGKSPL